MTKTRNSITITLNGSAQRYYAYMYEDIKDVVKKSYIDNEGIIPVITDAHVIRRIINEYFYLKYGKDEMRKVRNEYNKELFGELEQQSKELKQRYA